MRMGVLGSGMTAQAISARLAELGHDVVIGTRVPLPLQTADLAAKGDYAVLTAEDLRKGTGGPKENP